LTFSSLKNIHPLDIGTEDTYKIVQDVPEHLVMTMENGTDALVPEHSKYFLWQWTVTVPSYPFLKFYRATPSRFDDWIPIMTDPKNNELQDTHDKIWDEAAIAKWKTETEARYHESNTKFEPLEVLIEYEGKAVGYGDVWPTSGSASIGILLNEAVRGRGIGKTAMAVLAQIGFDFNLPISTGTMKANVAMRALMASLGVAEEEKLVTAPGRGVLAEVVYGIKPENWKKVEMKIEFNEEELSAEGNP
jgi:RimJ/RimL family protein N-acetyltransferase